MPAAASTASPSARASSCEAPGVVVARAQRVDRVAQVEQQLGVLPAGDVGPGDRLEARRPERRGDGLGDVVDAGRPAADVEDRRGVAGVRLHDARLEVPRRRHHRDAVHGGEAAQEGDLVGHAVLQAHDRRVEAARTSASASTTPAVSWLLTATIDDVVRPERQLGRVADDRHRQRHRALRPLDGQAALGDGGAVLAAGHEHDVVAVLEHATADDATDGTGSVDDRTARQAATGSWRRSRGDVAGDVDHPRRRRATACGRAATRRRSARAARPGRSEPDVDRRVARVDGQQRHHGPSHPGPHHRQLGAVVVGAEHERRIDAARPQPVLDLQLAAARRVADQRRCR